jgi:hypothetical protein
MKKKIMMALAVCMMAVLFVSCTYLSGAVKIEITGTPRNTFTQNEEISSEEIFLSIRLTQQDADPMDINLYYENGSLVEKSGLLSFKIINFNLEVLGERTATITYTYDNHVANAYFDYSVVPSTGLFAGGNGTSINPYEITSAEQFLNINELESTEEVFFKLTNDIDMQGLEASIKPVNNLYQGMNWQPDCFIKEMKGTFDGNGKKIINAQNIDSRNEKFIFGHVTGTIENLSVYTQGTMPIVFVSNDLVFNNVKAYGFTTGIVNNGCFLLSATSGSTVEFNDCENHVDVIGNEIYVAAFVGYPDKNVRISFNNCNNYGTIEAQSAGVLVCNVSSNPILTVNNCSNEGKIVGTTSANFVAATANVDAQFGDTIVKGSLVKIDNSSFSLSFNENNQFTIAKTEAFNNNIKTIKVIITTAFDVNSETIRTLTDEIYSNEMFTENTLTVETIGNYSITFGANETNLVELKNNQYVYDYSKTGETAETVELCSRVPYLMVMGYNEAGELIACSQKLNITNYNA